MEILFLVQSVGKYHTIDESSVWYGDYEGELRVFATLLTEAACCTVDSAAVGLALRKPMAPKKKQTQDGENKSCANLFCL